MITCFIRRRLNAILAAGHEFSHESPTDVVARALVMNLAIQHL